MSGNLLDDAQRAALEAHAREWTDRALSTDPVDWQRWEAGARRCYDYLAVRWPGNVVRVTSPLALARALFLARVEEMPGDEERALVGMVRGMLQERLDGLVSKLYGRAGAVQAMRAVFAPVDAALAGDAVSLAVQEALLTASGIADPLGTKESARAAARRFAPSTVKLSRANRTAKGWVVGRPTVAAIHAELNVEVRRCGIEALGWDVYLAEAGLRLVDTADDPGNGGFELRLYDVPAEVWGEPARVLLATNGSPERDGTRRRYGLPVPADMDTAVHAAAWTYGLTRDQYEGLARRT